MTNMMKALVKAKAEPGLWMERVPVPEIGPDDVLIRIRKTGICGTDIHIWNWDEWAQRTVPVPLVTGHEFAGEIVEIGRNVEGLLDRPARQRGGSSDRQALPPEPGGQVPPRPRDARHRRERAGGFRRIPAAPGLQRGAAPRRHRRRDRRDPRPTRQRRAHGAVLRPRGRGRAHHRRRSHRHHGRRRRPPRGRASCGDHRPQRRPAGARRAGGRRRAR